MIDQNELGPTDSGEVDEAIALQSKSTKSRGLKTFKKPVAFGVAAVCILTAGGLAYNSLSGQSVGRSNNGYVSIADFNQLRAQFDLLKSNQGSVKSELQTLQKSVVTASDKQELIDETINKLRPIVSSTVQNSWQSSISPKVKSQVESTIDARLMPYSNFNSSQVETNETYSKDISELKLQVEKLMSVGVISPVHDRRVRLKEFSGPVMVDEGIYTVQAPNRGGEKHWITLWKGEHFFSKVGRHVVTDIIPIDERTAKLLIDDKYFIDEAREDFSSSELAEIQSKSSPIPSKKKVSVERVSTSKTSKRNAIQNTETSSENVGVLPKEVTKTQTIPSSYGTNEEEVPTSIPSSSLVNSSNKSESLAYKNGKILLPTWATITQDPGKGTALVVNLASSDNKPVRIEINQTYDFIGRVRSITPEGVVCSDVYCIGALQ